MGTYQIDDSSGDNDGILDPGETVLLTIPTLNTGHALSPIAQATLSCSENLITIQNAIISLGQLEAGGSVNAIFTVTASSQLFEGTPISFNYSVDAGVYDLDEEISMTVGLIIEDFESGNFNMLDWYFSGDADWSITESDVYEGNYCAKSGDISNNSITSIMIDVILSREGDICFWKKVSTEVNYDYLRFFIDGIMQDEWSGEIGWSEEIFSIPTGNHTLKWVYEKDYLIANGQDCVWIDFYYISKFLKLRFPMTSHFKSFIISLLRIIRIHLEVQQILNLL